MLARLRALDPFKADLLLALVFFVEAVGEIVVLVPDRAKYEGVAVLLVAVEAAALAFRRRYTVIAVLAVMPIQLDRQSARHRVRRQPRHAVPRDGADALHDRAPPRRPHRPGAVRLLAGDGADHEHHGHVRGHADGLPADRRAAGRRAGDHRSRPPPSHAPEPDAAREARAARARAGRERSGGRRGGAHADRRRAARRGRARPERDGRAGVRRPAARRTRPGARRRGVPRRRDERPRGADRDPQPARRAAPRGRGAGTGAAAVAAARARRSCARRRRPACPSSWSSRARRATCRSASTSRRIAWCRRRSAARSSPATRGTPASSSATAATTWSSRSIDDGGEPARPLLGIHERVTLAHGQLQAGARRDGGHVVRARLPLGASA